MYGEHVGVKGLNLSVERGETFGLLGPNGAGKSTTIRVCLDLIRKTSGEVKIFGLDSRAGSKTIRRKTGYLPGDFGLIPKVTVRDYLKYLLSLNDIRDASRMEELASRLDLDLSRKTDELSKGNKQKVGIVQAFMTRPELIILDEPTSGLDPLVQHEFQRIVREEKARGATLLISSHVLPEVESVCDRVGIIKNGALSVVEHISTLQEKTGKIIEVEFIDAVDPAVFQMDGVTEATRDNGRIVIRVSHNFDTVVKRLADHRIRTMNVRTFSMEELFMKYYSEDAK